MTGNLDKLMILRDLKAAEDVSKKAALGWFDVEFTMYGCAYLNPQDQMMYYKVSPEAKDIYDFIEHAPEKNIYPSNVLCLSEKYPVPSGMKEAIAYEVKKKMAKELRDLYPKSFFEILYSIAQENVSNNAGQELWDVIEEIQGIFEERKLKVLEECVNFAKSTLCIDESQHQQLTEWIMEERANMVDDCISKDIFEKTMHGFAALQNKKIKYFSDARKEIVCERKNRLEREGWFVTPVLSRTYWYNYSYRLSDAIKDYQEELRLIYNDSFIDWLRKLKFTGKKKIGQESFVKMKDEIEKLYGSNAVETLVRYLFFWGLVRDEDDLQ